MAALEGKSTHFLVRMAGVQSCARMQMDEALPQIRRMAEDSRTSPTHLRVVAIAALGDLGGQTDMELLERLAANAEGQLRSAAALAAKKIKKRAAETKHETKAPEKVPAGPSRGGKEEPTF